MDRVEELKQLIEGIWAASEHNPGPFTPIKFGIDKTRAYLNGDTALPSVEHLQKTFKPIEDLYMESARSGIRGSRLRDLAPSNGLAFGFRNILNGLNEEDFELLKTEISEHHEERPVAPVASLSPTMGTGVFVGHGRSRLYHEVVNFLRDDCNVKVETFERNRYVGGQIIPVLQKVLAASGFAVIVATAEDETADGLRARQNVVHEIGLFQGKLGFERVAILRQEGVETWSNTDGLLVLPFSGDDVRSTFLDLDRALRAMDMMPS